MQEAVCNFLSINATGSLFKGKQDNKSLGWLNSAF
jgi:hypothetical protein